MSEPSLELDKPNAVGVLDRVTTNIAISLIAVIPTFLTCIFTPWRLSGLLKGDDPEGRLGMLLAPGAFFPLSLLVSMLAGALLTTPEIASNNGAFLGPDLALSIQSAVSEGDVWKTLSIIMPLYVFAVLVGSMGLILKPWAHQDWSLRVSLRAVFYVTGTLIAWIILSTAALDLIRLYTQDSQSARILLSAIPIPTLALLFWMYFWFFRNGGVLSLLRSALLSVAMIIFKILTVISLGVLSSI